MSGHTVQKLSFIHLGTGTWIQGESYSYNLVFNSLGGGRKDSESICLDLAKAIQWDFCTHTVQHLPANASQEEGGWLLTLYLALEQSFLFFSGTSDSLSQGGLSLHPMWL